MKQCAICGAQIEDDNVIELCAQHEDHANKELKVIDDPELVTSFAALQEFGDQGGIDE